MSRRWSILSVPDIHHASPDTNYSDDDKDLGLPALRDSIFDDFHGILRDLPAGSFDVVAVGGDITTHGKSDGFASFERDSLPLLKELAATTLGLCIVPGNHDVVWGLDPRERAAFERKFGPFGDLLRRHQLTTCLIPQGELTVGHGDKIRFEAPASGPVYVDTNRKIIVCALNSAIRCGERGVRMTDDVYQPLAQLSERLGSPASADALGAEQLTAVIGSLQRYLIRDVAHVTKAQQKLVEQALRRTRIDLAEDWDEYLRVGVLHHHLVPFANQAIEHRGYELLVDASHVLSLFADFDFDVVVTGHKHQSYTQQHSSGERHMLLVGGATIGGASVAESFRGVQVIDVEEKDGARHARVSEISCKLNGGQAAKRIRELRERAVPHSVATPDAALNRRARQRGFYYREIASVTRIDEDGDARRTIECEDLVVTDPSSPRGQSHSIALPATSGTLTGLRARALDFTIQVRPQLTNGDRVQAFATELMFDQRVGAVAPASYRYEWWAVNAFALDRDQFDNLYDEVWTGRYVEFTHFRSEDPVRELAVVVQFPRGYQLRSVPRLRVARPLSNEPDGRKWEIDVAAERDLESEHALRFYESLNMAGLRVRRPSPALSYGIEWDVPSVERPVEDGRAVADEFWAGWSGGRFGADERQRLTDLLGELLRAVRLGFAPGWTGPLDASLIWHAPGRGGSLVVVAAALEEEKRRDGRPSNRKSRSRKATRKARYEYTPVKYESTLRYGDGIAGRALKSNQIRVYVAPTMSSDVDEPDYYIKVEGIEPHMVVVSLPIRFPESPRRFLEKPDIYSAKRPYAVLSFGSTRRHCPLSALRNPEHISALLRFQHNASERVFGEITTIVNKL